MRMSSIIRSLSGVVLSLTMKFSCPSIEKPQSSNRCKRRLRPTVKGSTLLIFAVSMSDAIRPQARPPSSCPANNAFFGRVAKSVEIPAWHLRAGFVWRSLGRGVKNGGFEPPMQGLPAIHLSHLDLA